MVCKQRNTSNGSPAMFHRGRKHLRWLSAVVRQGLAYRSLTPVIAMDLSHRRRRQLRRVDSPTGTTHRTVIDHNDLRAIPQRTPPWYLRISEQCGSSAWLCQSQRSFPCASLPSIRFLLFQSLGDVQTSLRHDLSVASAPSERSNRSPDFRWQELIVLVDSLARWIHWPPIAFDLWSSFQWHQDETARAAPSPNQPQAFSFCTSCWHKGKGEN